LETQILHSQSDHVISNITCASKKIILTTPLFLDTVLKKIPVKSFFSGDLVLDPGHIQNIPSSLIQVVLEAITSLGSNVKVKKAAKQHGRYNLLQELECCGIIE